MDKKGLFRKKFLQHAVPVMVTVIIVIFLYSYLVIPMVRGYITEQKKDKIQSIVDEAIYTINEFRKLQNNKTFSEESAKKLSLEHFRNFRYGDGNKDYIWIHALNKEMLMHPYTTSLEGTDVSEYKDPAGRKVFSEMNDIVRKDGSGFYRYSWQWQDNESLIYPKISYVKLYRPWGWVIGTGVYLHDIEKTLEEMTGKITLSLSLFSVLILMIISVYVMRSMRLEREVNLKNKLLSESEKQYKILFNNIDDMVFLQKASEDFADHKVEDINDAVVDKLGFSREEILGKPFNDLFRVKETARGTLKDIVIKKDLTTSLVYEGDMSKKSGEKISVEIISHLFMFDGDIHILSVARDVTERRKIFEQLEESEKRYRRLAESMSDVVWVCDEDLKYIYMSPSVKKVRGYDPEYYLGKSVFFAVFEEDKEFVKKTIDSYKKQFLEKGGDFNPDPIEARIVISSELIMWVELSLSVIFDEEGAVSAYVGVARDINERKMHEKELLELITQLQESNTELERFAYVAAHDLRDPMRTVSMSIETISKKYRNVIEKEDAEYLDYAIHGSQKMHKLIKDLLDYSRIRQQVIRQEDVDLNEIFSIAVENLKTVIDECGAEIAADKLPVVKGEPLHFVQLFQNLISNALKFRNKSRTATIEVRFEDKGDRGILSVIDNGIGIEKEYYDKIFNIFDRLHTYEEYPGTGIGLTICRKIVELYGDRLAVESDPGRGSKFYFGIKIERKGQENE